MPDPFSTLPLPLPLFMLDSIDDLCTLHYLLIASPSANAIFTRYYREIIESILSNFFPELQQLIRMVLSIRSQPSRVRAQWLSPETFETFRGNISLGRNVGKNPFPEYTTSLSAVRSLAKTASQIQDLSAAFFVTHLQRINNIKPYCSLGGNACATDTKILVPDPRLGRYEIIPCEAPSWIEEQRVLRSLWSVVVWLDLKEIMRPVHGAESEVWDNLVNGGPQWLWSLERFKQRGWYYQRHAWRLQELQCVLDYLCEQSVGSHELAGQLSHLRSLPAVNPVRFSSPIPAPSQDTCADRWWTLGNIEKCWWRSAWQSPRCLRGPSPGYYYFYKLQCGDDHMPFENYDFSPLRALGLGIWDKEKLARLGLAFWGSRCRAVPEMYLFGPRKEIPNGVELVIRWKSLMAMS